MSLVLLYQHLSEEGGIAEEKELCKELAGSHCSWVPGKWGEHAVSLHPAV